MIDIDDNEIISRLSENDEEVRNIIYDKYVFICDVCVKKYSRLIRMFQIDEEELRAEALCGFSDGINSYSENKGSSLKTFLFLCVERRVEKYLAKQTNNKAKIINSQLSLDTPTDNSNTPIIDLISDDGKEDPLNNLTYFETFNELIEKAKNELSPFEYKVFLCMINEMNYIQISEVLEKTPKQIDNAIQRIKLKLRDFLK